MILTRLLPLLPCWFLACAAGRAAEPAPKPPRLATTAELSGFTRTGRHEEAVRLCREFERAYPGRARAFTFGTTPEGRAMTGLVASADGALTPEACRRRGRPVLLFQGGIHAGEIDGKDAGFWALRDMLDGQLAPGALERVTVVFVPIFNVDGHERFGPNNRPNQTGPVEMGWRTTAQNLNLNRDYLKADAPEMRAMLALLTSWDPAGYVDLHVTDGAQFQVDLGVMIDPAQAGPEPLATLARSVRAETIDRLTRQGWLATPFYPTFKDENDPMKGCSLGNFGARLSNGYWASRNRLGILVETHSWKDYARRVRMTRDVIVALVEIAARDGAAWLDALRATDAAVAGWAGQDVTLAWENTEASHLIDFPGYRFTRRPSAISGAPMIEYDVTAPETYRIPLYDEVRPSFVATAPRGGYVVPAAWAERIAPLLEAHGVRFSRLAKALPGSATQAFRVASATFAKESFEGRFETKVTGAWGAETRDIPPGSLFVPIAQPEARLVMTMFEPTCGESLMAWGFFPTCLEKKEYMEPYVAEQAALEMMKADPKLSDEFLARLASDPSFASSPAARLEFFYRRHPAWDERFNLHPVLRTDAALAEKMGRAVQ